MIYQEGLREYMLFQEGFREYMIFQEGFREYIIFQEGFREYMMDLWNLADWLTNVCFINWIVLRKQTLR